MSETNEAVLAQRACARVVMGIIKESADLSFQPADDYIAKAKVRQYVVELLVQSDLDPSCIEVYTESTFQGDVVNIVYDDILRYSLMKNEVVRAMTMSTLINLGESLRSIPEHLIGDPDTLQCLGDIAYTLGLDESPVFTEAELDAALASYQLWGESTTLPEYIQAAAVAYLPGMAFRRENVIKRAFMAYHMLQRAKVNEDKEAPEARG